MPPPGLGMPPRDVSNSRKIRESIEVVEHR
jgi:hypothetical protein